VQDVEKAAKVSEKVVPNVIARSFATTSVRPPFSSPPHPSQPSSFVAGDGLRGHLIFPLGIGRLTMCRGNYETCDPSSRPSWWRQAYLRPYLRRSILPPLLWDRVLMARPAVFSKSSLKVLFVMLSPTPNTPSERPSHPSMSSTL
jgi:hypothetical protein